ncbi:MAG: META domain-containing protein [Fluviicola sp.]
MKRLISLLTILALGWNASAQRTLKMVVNEVPQNCQRMMPQQCLNVKINGSKQWELFYENIQGFDYQAGYVYELVVTETPRPEPIPADLSKLMYKLVKVVSKKAVPVSDQVVHWKIAKFNGKAPANDNVWIGFSDNLDRLSGQLGCNSFNGALTWNKKKTKVTIGELAGTRMYCEGFMDEEKALSDALRNQTFKLTNKNGVWVWKSKKTTLELEAVTVEKPAVENKSPWEYFSNKKLVVLQVNGTSIGDIPAHIIFDNRSWRFAGNTGCNQVSGGFNSDGTTLNFTEVVSTKKACIDEKITRVERELLEIMRMSGLTVDFAEQVLNVYDVNGRIVLMLAVNEKR